MLPFCDVGELQSKERGPGRFVLGGFPPISTLQSIVLIIIPTGRCAQVFVSTNARLARA